MELRHLRYFIAVVEEGSLTVAADRRLHTSQPSLSRQIRDLEYEIGTPLMTRSVRGIELTAAGEAFLVHARMALAQVGAGVEAARQAGRPAKMQFNVGFLTGQEMDWLPEAMRILKSDLCNIDVVVSSQYSPDLEYKLIAQEPLLVFLPSDHPLASSDTIDPKQLLDEKFIGMSATAPTVNTVIDNYLKKQGLIIKPAYTGDNLGMFMSLVASTRGVTLLPAYARNFLPWSVTSRPLLGEPPTIDLVIGYSRKNTSRVLKLFLSRVDELIERVAKASEL